MKLSDSWQKLLNNDWQIIQKENVDIFKQGNKKALSLVFKLTPELSQKINEDLLLVIPDDLNPKIIFQ
jgi:hypothetical protein